MNYIFLDIDGVLNSEKFLLEHKQKILLIDSENVKLLAELVRKTNSQIILSSSWRMFLNDDLSAKGSHGQILIDSLSDFDLCLSGKTSEAYVEDSEEMWERPEEIQKYIRDHLDASDNFIILDDEDCGLKKKFKDHFIQTNFFLNGLTKGHVDKGIEILNKKGD